MKDTNKIPSILLNRFKTCWSKVNDVVKSFQSDGKKHWSKQVFLNFCTKIGCNLLEKEINEIFDNYAVNEQLNYARLIEDAKDIIYPQEAVGVGALLQSGGDNHKARSGRAINIPLLQAGWNNRHHQAMDSSNEGQTCIQNVLEGKFYHEKHPSVTTKDFCRGSRGAEIDKKLNQPLVKSLIEGEYYFTKYDHVAKNRKHTNFISQNRRLAADYSQFMIDARRSMHELSMDPSRTATPQISVPLAKYSRLRKSTSRQSYDYGSQSLLSLSMYPNSGSEVGSQRTSRRGGSIRLGKSDHTVTHTIGNTRSISRRPQSATHLRTEIADFSFDEGHSKPVSRSPGHVQPSMLPPPPRYGVDKKILADATAVARSRINGVRLDPETRRAK